MLHAARPLRETNAYDSNGKIVNGRYALDAGVDWEERAKATARAVAESGGNKRRLLLTSVVARQLHFEIAGRSAG